MFKHGLLIDPVYQLADTTSEEKTYLYRVGGRWWWGKEVGSEEVKLRACRSGEGSTSSLPPSSGWVWRNTGMWLSLADLRIVQRVVKPCAQISLKGAIEGYSRYSSIYTPVEGVLRRGQQVTFAKPYCALFSP